ncbi:phytoene desaturase family protein [Algivirga pacifica]|uniref:Phytoene desaturase family protein n=1 Tax=Algivirga pacifica TaxID=1162670 RepID=A0ABP9DM49_9BACT
MENKVIIIGAGFSSLASACFLAQAGMSVTVLEKNNTAGGRARRLEEQGFTFDIGPTFYWMPDVFERFFAYFDKKPSDYYQLERLDPGYEVYFDKKTSFKVSGEVDKIYELFEEVEAGSAKHLQQFLKDARSNYEIAINDLVYKPGFSLSELVTWQTVTRVNKFFDNISSSIKRKIKNKRLVQLLEFPVLFLGAKPSTTPAFYNFMNYADFELGTWHPKGGMYEVVEGMKKLAEDLGVQFYFDQNVEKIITEKGKAKGVVANGITFDADVVLSGADYAHTESLLPVSERMYSESYWKKKTFAPSALLFYIGFNKKLENVSHHTLFFDTDFEKHAEYIYDLKQWPESPLFYGSFPSITDDHFAPEGKEAATILIPIAPGLEDSEALREKYFKEIIERMEKLTGQSLQDDIVFHKSYCINDFVEDYNAYKGNAYGLANTLFQTAYFRPKIKSKKVDNLYFTGQLTVPGPGVPPSLISGKIVSDQIISKLKPTKQHEKTV